MDQPLIGGGRPMRTCIGCGQTDDHPRHVIDTGTTQDVTWHIDCHAVASPPCGSCAAQAAVATGTGQQMLDAILAHHTPTQER